MERERITADQAFQLLRRSSQHLNRKLRAVAQDIVDYGVISPEDSASS
jgi:AmiR/NasT family two-component response regulator